MTLLVRAHERWAIKINIDSKINITWMIHDILFQYSMNYYVRLFIAGFYQITKLIDLVDTILCLSIVLEITYVIKKNIHIIL